MLSAWRSPVRTLEHRSTTQLTDPLRTSVPICTQGRSLIASTTTLTAFATGTGYLPSAAEHSYFHEGTTRIRARPFEPCRDIQLASAGNDHRLGTRRGHSLHAGRKYTRYKRLLSIRIRSQSPAIALSVRWRLLQVSQAVPSQRHTTLSLRRLRSSISATASAPRRTAPTTNPQMILNGSTRLDDTRLQLTDGGYYEAGTAYYSQPIDIRSFTTDFSFQISNAGADGFTFTDSSEWTERHGRRGRRARLWARREQSRNSK